MMLKSPPSLTTYKLVTNLAEVDKAWIEQAVHRFADESDAIGNKSGLIQQTFENILHATELKSPGRYFWLVIKDNNPCGYVLSHVSKDVDNSLCYWGIQAYADPSVRGEAFIKGMYPILKEHAKSLFCKHILLPSSRNADAYMRWLGPDLKHYSSVLIETL